MDCTKCDALCCRNQPSMFLFPPEVETMTPLGVPITRYGPFGQFEAKMTKCPAVGPDNRCTIYADRPLVCRIFPTNLIIVATDPDPKKATVAVDFGACPQHVLKGKPPETTDMGVIAAWYGFALPQLWGMLARVFLKEMWRGHVMNQMDPAGVAQYNQRRQTDYAVALEHASQDVIRPLLPPRVINALAEVVKNVFNAYRANHTTWTTHQLCAWVEPRVCAVAQILYDLEVAFT